MNRSPEVGPEAFESDHSPELAPDEPGCLLAEAVNMATWDVYEQPPGSQVVESKPVPGGEAGETTTELACGICAAQFIITHIGDTFVRIDESQPDQSRFECEYAEDEDEL